MLIVTAAPAEARAAASAFGAEAPASDWRGVQCAPGWMLVRSGVGKVNAALATARGLEHAPDLVLNVGVCGALPAAHVPSIGSIIIGAAAVYADEGVATPDRFLDMAAQGFGYWPGAAVRGGDCSCSGFDAETELVRWADEALRSPHLGDLYHGAIATVSTCSGTGALATDIAARTGAIAEAMEGAAITHALRRLAPRVRFLEVRVVSNTTGDRAAQVWDLQGALAKLTQVVRALHAASPRLPAPPAGGTPAARAE